METKTMKYNEVDGNLIHLAKAGEFDVIAHGCNCFCNMASGLAPQMARAFGCDKFPMEDRMHKGNLNKLGCIDYKEEPLLHWFKDSDSDHYLTVVNAYTQYAPGHNLLFPDEMPVDYEAITMCMRKMNHIFRGKHIGLPLIGAGLAGGIWDILTLDVEDAEEFYVKHPKDILSIIKDELKDCIITIVNYKP